MNTKLFLVVGLLALGTAPDARADRRLSSLHDDVAVRHRRLLVKGRFEATPLFESSIGADYQHTIGGGLKLEYHFSDMLSFGAIGVASTSVHTGLVDNITATLPTQVGQMGYNPRDPTVEQFLDHLNAMPVHGAIYASITPWYGKLAAFSQAYVAFDFYFQGGISFASLTSNCPTSVCTDTHPGLNSTDAMGNVTPPSYNPNLDPPLNDGQRIGLYLGGGIHVFLSDFIALDLTVRDYAFSDNPSGADYNADQYVGKHTNPDGSNPNDGLGDDNRFLHHLFFGAGVSIMFPTTVKRTP